MLTIQLPSVDDQEEIVLHLEHSLVSLSKWESEKKKAFFGKDGMTPEDTLYYIESMILGEIPSGDWSKRLTLEHSAAISDYINDSQSATWFREDPTASKSREIVTNELIYFWMIDLGIPFEPCQHWHLNRLMTLIRICSIKRTKPKKMSKNAQRAEMAELNALRRQQLGTSG